MDYMRRSNRIYVPDIGKIDLMFSLLKNHRKNKQNFVNWIAMAMQFTGMGCEPVQESVMELK